MAKDNPQDRQSVIDNWFTIVGKSPIRLAEMLTAGIAQEHRIVVAVTTMNEQVPLSRELSAGVSDAENLCEMWIIEALMPLPILTRTLDGTAREAYDQIVDWLARHVKEARIVIGSGLVGYGLVGTGLRRGFGSTGQVVCDVMAACFKLPFDSSWADESMRQALNLFAKDTIEIGSHKFGRICP